MLRKKREGLTRTHRCKRGGEYVLMLNVDRTNFDRSIACDSDRLPQRDRLASPGYAPTGPRRWYRAPELMLFPSGYFEAVDLRSAERLAASVPSLQWQMDRVRPNPVRGLHGFSHHW